MKFLADQCVYQTTIDLLRGFGFDVISLKDLNATTALDEKVLKLAKEYSRVLITNNLDFGKLVFYSSKEHSGVIILRINPLNENKVHSVMKIFLTRYKKVALDQTLVVVDKNKYRVRSSLKG